MITLKEVKGEIKRKTKIWIILCMKDKNLIGHTSEGDMYTFKAIEGHYYSAFLSESNTVYVIDRDGHFCLLRPETARDLFKCIQVKI